MAHSHSESTTRARLQGCTSTTTALILLLFVRITANMVFSVIWMAASPTSMSLERSTATPSPGQLMTAARSQGGSLIIIPTIRVSTTLTAVTVLCVAVTAA